MQSGDFLSNFKKEELLPSIVERGIHELKSSSLPTVFYGAGGYAKKIFNFLKKFDIYPDAALVDSNFLEGEFALEPGFIIDVLHIEGIAKKYAHGFNIVTAHQDPAKARSLCQRLPQAAQCFEFESAAFPLWTWEFLIDNAEFLQNSFLMFEDELSKKTFINFIKQKISGDFHYSQDVFQPNKYLPSDIIQLHDKEVLVDGGAFTGDTAKLFIDSLENFHQLICFEPDPHNYQLLTQNINPHRKSISCYNCGLSDKEESIPFSATSDDSSSFTNIGAAGFEYAEVKSLDGLDIPVPTFIKLDIEGFELNALSGSREIISRYKPKLAVCAYHKEDDLITLPKFIKDLNKDYKLYLRKHSYTYDDLILYAI